MAGITDCCMQYLDLCISLHGTCCSLHVGQQQHLDYTAGSGQPNCCHHCLLLHGTDLYQHQSSITDVTRAACTFLTLRVQRLIKLHCVIGQLALCW